MKVGEETTNEVKVAPTEEQTTNVAQKAKGVKESEKTDGQVEGFFKSNPRAPKVYRVGTDLFLASSIGAAEYQSKLQGVELEEIFNPNIEKEVVHE